MSPPSNLIGVCICIAGNTCVSLALNVQKLAHLRLDNFENVTSDVETSSLTLSRQASSDSRCRPHASKPLQISESSPLLHPTASSPHVSTAPYQHRTLPLRSTATSPPGLDAISSRSSDSPDRYPSAVKHPKRYDSIHRVPHQTDYVPNNRSSHETSFRIKSQDDDSTKSPLSSTYLRSKLWWSGLSLMALGETGNFLSYGFAPASLVAPLGTVALMANCFFAPLLLKERFRKRDLAGILLCLVGAVTVVYSSEGRNKFFNPDQFLDAICQPAFITYSVICVVLAIFLAIASRTKLGDDYIVIDLGLCAILGAFTVLSTKAIASFINELFVKTFQYWITYPILAVLILTAVAQVAYLNKALQRFDAKSVVPTQYVFFTISTILGSAILYQEFEQVSFDKVLNFLLGCLTVFVGVYVLTTLSPSEFDDSEESEANETLIDPNAASRKSPAFPVNPTTPTRKGTYTLVSPLSSARTIPSTPPLSAGVNRQRSLSMLRAAASRPKSAGYLLIASSPHDPPTENTSRRSSITENDDQIQSSPIIITTRRPSSSLRTESRVPSTLRADSETSHELDEEPEHNEH